MTCIRFPKLLTAAVLLVVAAPLLAQTPASPPAQAGGNGAAQATKPPAPKPEDTEVWEPEPAVVTPGASCMAPPSDAIVLFDGKNQDEWVSNRDKSPAKWTVADGVFT